MKRSYGLMWSLAVVLAVLGFAIHFALDVIVALAFYGVAGIFALFGCVNFCGSRFHRRFAFQAWWLLVPGLACWFISGFTLFMARPGLGTEQDLVRIQFWTTFSWIFLIIGLVILPCIAFFIRGMDFEMSPEMQRAADRRRTQGPRRPRRK